MVSPVFKRQRDEDIGGVWSECSEIAVYTEPENAYIEAPVQEPYLLIYGNRGSALAAGYVCDSGLGIF